MKKDSKPRLLGYKKLAAHVICAAATAGLAFSVHAQGSEESLDSELDAELESMKDFAPAAPAVEKKASEPTLTEIPVAEETVTPQGSSDSLITLDEPNLGLEKRLFRIFQNSEPVSQSRWDEILGPRRSESYDVQSGDTLWDLSKTLFGDGFFWSKLWAENSSFENPHLLEPGQSIRFIAGDEAEGPAFAVRGLAEAETEPFKEEIKVNPTTIASGSAPSYKEEVAESSELQDATAAQEVEELIPKPEIPVRKTKPVLKKLPASFKNTDLVDSTGNYDITGLDAGEVRSLTTPASVVPNSYLADAPPKGIGKIEEIELGETVASDGQIVIVKLDRPAKAGEKFSVVFPKGKIKDKIHGFVGPVVEVGGRIKIRGPLDAKKNIYRAEVTANYNPIRVNSVVLEEALPQTNFKNTGARIHIRVRVIGGEFDEKRVLVGEHSVIYLDGGANAGLTVGDVLPVQSYRGNRRKDSKFPSWSRNIGLIKIVKVEPSVATAIVLEAKEEIVIGDRTGGPNRDRAAASGDDMASAADVVEDTEIEDPQANAPAAKSESSSEEELGFDEL